MLFLTLGTLSGLYPLSETLLSTSQLYYISLRCQFKCYSSKKPLNLSSPLVLSYNSLNFYLAYFNNFKTYLFLWLLDNRYSRLWETISDCVFISSVYIIRLDIRRCSENICKINGSLEQRS